ncbi:hypothetical protein M949_0024 [Riemerella anatipestifer CH3]|nr:hypothetical protein M949_0024 [Riemerella anatipestifer CH3]
MVEIQSQEEKVNKLNYLFRVTQWSKDIALHYYLLETF